MSRRLMDQMKHPPVDDKPAEFPFVWTHSLSTDVAKTWDRLCPGWRERKPGESPKVALITQQTRRKK